MKNSLFLIVKSLLAACLCIHTFGCGSGAANGSTASSIELATDSTAGMITMDTTTVSGSDPFLLTSNAGADGGMLPVE